MENLRLHPAQIMFSTEETEDAWEDQMEFLDDVRMYREYVFQCYTCLHRSSEPDVGDYFCHRYPPQPGGVDVYPRVSGEYGCGEWACAQAAGDAWREDMRRTEEDWLPPARLAKAGVTR